MKLRPGGELLTVCMVAALAAGCGTGRKAQADDPANAGADAIEVRRGIPNLDSGGEGN